MRRTVVAGALGNCVHVAGVVGFLKIAEELGFGTVFLGAAVSVSDFVEAVEKHDPEIVGVSYRLTPEVAEGLIAELKAALDERGLSNRVFLFGGTPPVCEIADRLGWFDRSFNGLESPEEVWAYLRGGSTSSVAENFGDTLIERLKAKAPYPVIRHHFGLPDMQETIAGARKIAESGVVDVISIAPDQNAQESFFRQDQMNPALDGAGGAPIRTAEHLRELRRAVSCGNRPMLRIYSGTRDLIQWAELATETVNNAWAAIPLCWYSALDGRSTRSLAEAIAENQACMRWYGERDIPVEVNEAHHWSLRDAHDTISVVMAYIAAYNARLMGVKHYVAQYMFNSPPGIHPKMDLAKILAQIEIVESLHGPYFTSFRQVRAGLLSLSPHLNVAKGQLAASTMLALAVKPHIIHVVGYCEGDHAASPDDVIESCEIARGVVKNCLFGLPDMASDPAVIDRKNELLAEAEVTLSAMRDVVQGDEDPLSGPQTLAEATKRGILDAPHLRGNPSAAGKLKTRVVNGAVCAVDTATDEVVSEKERLARLSLDNGEIFQATPFKRALV